MASVYYLFAPDEARIPTQAALLASLREQFADAWRIETETPLMMQECIYLRADDGWFIRLLVSEPEADTPGDFSPYYKKVKKLSPFDFTRAQRYIHVLFKDDPDDLHTSSSGLVMLEWLREQAPDTIIFAAGSKTLL